MGTETATTCPQCFGAGWVLEAKVDREPTTLELAVLCRYGEWGKPVTHPTTGAVMSLKRTPNGRWTAPASSGRTETQGG